MSSMTAVIPADKLFNVLVTVNSLKGRATVAGPSALTRKYPGDVALKNLNTTWVSNCLNIPNKDQNHAIFLNGYFFLPNAPYLFHDKIQNTYLPVLCFQTPTRFYLGRRGRHLRPLQHPMSFSTICNIVLSVDYLEGNSKESTPRVANGGNYSCV